MKAFKTRPRIGPTLSIILISVASYVVLFTLIAVAIAPPQFDLRIGEVAPITITASKDVEDEIGTQRLMEQAARAVQPSYTFDSSVAPEVNRQLRDSFERFVSVRELRLGPEGEILPITGDVLISAASAFSPASLGEEALRLLLDSDEETLIKLSSDALRLARAALDSQVTEGKEEETVSSISRNLITLGYSRDLVNVATTLLREYMQPNMLLDEATTEANRAKAREEVEPILFKRGQNIVRSGEVVTASQMAMLDSLGMIKDRGVDWSMYLGIALMILLMIGVIGLYLYTFEPELLGDPRRIALLMVIIMLVMALSLLVRGLSSFLMPVTLGTMLTTLLLKPRLALITGIVLAILTGLIASATTGVFSTTMFTVILTSIFSSALCVALMRKRQQRSNVLLTGGFVALFNAITTIGAGLTNSANLQSVFLSAVWSAGSGLLSAILCIGLQPALEWVFNIDTATKLLELSNPNQPLLRRLMLEAPGTYHHSIVVANLAEAGASAIGSNGLLARVGAYYHDIGKLKRPMYFKENQLNDNPHDRTDPRVSTAILTSHPTDGIQMAQKQRLPIPVQDIILQHHGDSPVLYFYDKAIKQGIAADIADFRYTGPRPRSKESAIVMLADTVEASTRSLRDSSPENIHQLIQRMLRSKMEDGQLDESPMTFSDLKLVGDAFMTVLMGVFHQRIEYPNIEIPERNELPDLPVEAVAAPEDIAATTEIPAPKKPAMEKPAPPASESPAPDKPVRAKPPAQEKPAPPPSQSAAPEAPVRAKSPVQEENPPVPPDALAQDAEEFTERDA